MTHDLSHPTTAAHTPATKQHAESKIKQREPARSGADSEPEVISVEDESAGWTEVEGKRESTFDAEGAKVEGVDSGLRREED
jgi:hypothetical protein